MRNIEKEADEHVQLMASIMGITPGATIAETRHKINHLNKYGYSADLGIHPKGREYTVEELVERFRAGELADVDGVLREPGVSPKVTPMDEGELQEHDAIEGFFVSGSDQEASTLWLHLVLEGLDLAGFKGWRSKAQGQRWEHGARFEGEWSILREVFERAHERYGEVWRALQVEQPEASSYFTADELLSILGEA